MLSVIVVAVEQHSLARWAEACGYVRAARVQHDGTQPDQHSGLCVSAIILFAYHYASFFFSLELLDISLCSMAYCCGNSVFVGLPHCCMGSSIMFSSKTEVSQVDTLDF